MVPRRKNSFSLLLELAAPVVARWDEVDHVGVVRPLGSDAPLEVVARPDRPQDRQLRLGEMEESES